MIRAILRFKSGGSDEVTQFPNVPLVGDWMQRRDGELEAMYYKVEDIVWLKASGNESPRELHVLVGNPKDEPNP